MVKRKVTRRSKKLKKYSLVLHTHPLLKKVSEKVFDFNKGLTDLVHGMFHICRTSNIKGVGLAAVQVGQLKRVIVVEHPRYTKALVNPVIGTSSKETDILEEGCLSHPGVWIPLERSVEIVVSYYTLEGLKITETVEGYPARIIQHEGDHLDGINITDKIPAVVPKLAASTAVRS